MVLYKKNIHKWVSIYETCECDIEAPDIHRFPRVDRLSIGVLMTRDNSRATRTRLGQNSTRVSSTQNVNESSRATRNSTRKAREKLENILYIKF